VAKPIFQNTDTAMQSKQTSPILGIVGAGAMGSGIAQVAMSAGIEVRLFDNRPDVAAKSKIGIAERLQKRVAEGKLNAVVADGQTALLHPSDDIRFLAGCTFVVEAIVEDLEAKRAVFKTLEGLVSADTVLASNTSSLPIGAIASGLKHRHRIGGLHFFNPVPLMKLVEVIPGPETSREVLDALVNLGARLGREPIVVRDTPGFLVNLGGRAYTTEGLAVLHENVATPAQIDAIMRDCCGFRMGPFELMDLTGVDVNFPVTRFIHEGFFSDPRLRSTPYHRYLLETGQLGRKSGRGFYQYDETEKPSADEWKIGESATKVYLVEPTEELANLVASLGLSILDSDDGVSPLLISPLGEDVSAFVKRSGCDVARTVALDLSFDTTRRITVMTAPGADPLIRQAVTNALIDSGRSVTSISDSPGFVAQRIVGMVANLGCEMAQAGLAEPHDIDKAMRLGLNYPLGPLELTDAFGPSRVLSVLASIQALTGDDRYRPSQWLRRRASLGLPVWMK
jgi:3-hydroxybutyryl-CoA dehydrogenase